MKTAGGLDLALGPANHRVSDLIGVDFVLAQRDEALDLGKTWGHVVLGHSVHVSSIGIKLREYHRVATPF